MRMPNNHDNGQAPVASALATTLPRFTTASGISHGTQQQHIHRHTVSILCRHIYRPTNRGTNYWEIGLSIFALLVAPKIKHSCIYKWVSKTKFALLVFRLRNRKSNIAEKNRNLVGIQHLRSRFRWITVCSRSAPHKKQTQLSPLIPQFLSYSFFIFFMQSAPRSIWS